MLWCVMGKMISVGCHLRKFVHAVVMRGVTVGGSGSGGVVGGGSGG